MTYITTSLSKNKSAMNQSHVSYSSATSYGLSLLHSSALAMSYGLMRQKGSKGANTRSWPARP